MLRGAGAAPTSVSGGCWVQGVEEEEEEEEEWRGPSVNGREK